MCHSHWLPFHTQCGGSAPAEVPTADAEVMAEVDGDWATGSVLPGRSARASMVPAGRSPTRAAGGSTTVARTDAMPGVEDVTIPGLATKGLPTKGSKWNAMNGRWKNKGTTGVATNVRRKTNRAGVTNTTGLVPMTTFVDTTVTFSTTKGECTKDTKVL